LKAKGISVNLYGLIGELREQERPVAPLRPVDDAVCIDTEYLLEKPRDISYKFSQVLKAARRDAITGLSQ
jgi:hypothetical protein